MFLLESPVYQPVGMSLRRHVYKPWRSCQGRPHLPPVAPWRMLYNLGDDSAKGHEWEERHDQHRQTDQNGGVRPGGTAGTAAASRGTCAIAPGAGAGARSRACSIARPMRIPDVAGYAVGWRIWTSEKPPLPACLSSLRGTRWPHRTPLIAGCRTKDVLPSFDPQYRTRLHDTPDESCTCGIYAVRTEEQLVSEHVGLTTSALIMRQMASEFPVNHIIGKVALWGKVIEYTDEFRAEYAYTLELWAFETPQAVVSDLHLGYGVPVHRVSAREFLSDFWSRA